VVRSGRMRLPERPYPPAVVGWTLAAPHIWGWEIVKRRTEELQCPMRLSDTTRTRAN
jgi:hypothetical protein